MTARYENKALRQHAGICHCNSPSRRVLEKADWLMRLTDLAAADLPGLLRHWHNAINGRRFPAEPAGIGNIKNRTNQ